MHTTEFNISSNDRTLETGDTVIFRMSDIDQLVEELRSEGHYVEELDYSLGGLPEDFAVDVHPYGEEPHLKLQICEYVATSIGIIIQKRKKGIFNLHG